MNLFIPTDADGEPIITSAVTMALTSDILNNMSKELRNKVLSYPGDQDKWIAPKTWLGRLFYGSIPNHSWCPGKMRVFSTSGLLTHHEQSRCSHCGRTENMHIMYG